MIYNLIVAPPSPLSCSHSILCIPVGLAFISLRLSAPPHLVSPVQSSPHRGVDDLCRQVYGAAEANSASREKHTQLDNRVQA